MTIDAMLSSRAKFKCIQTLAVCGVPIHLRRIINLTRLQPRSVQIAMQALNKMRVVKSKKQGNKLYYELNRSAPHYQDLHYFIKGLQSSTINKRSETYQSLDASINFINTAKALLSTLKGANGYS